MSSLTPRAYQANDLQVRRIGLDLNGGKRWYLSDKDLTRHGDRLCYADTRFDLNPLNPIACSERT